MFDKFNIHIFSILSDLLIIASIHSSTFRLLANHSVTYFRCGPALWHQPWKSHKQTHVDEAWTTQGSAVGLPKQHSCCIFLGCGQLLYIGTHNGVDWWHDWAHAAKRFQFKSPRPCCLCRIDSTQTWGNEPWSVPSVCHDINGQGFRGHQSEGALHKGMMAIFYWFAFIIVTTSNEVWHQICCEKYFW